jgi:hypothetical protein
MEELNIIAKAEAAIAMRFGVEYMPGNVVDLTNVYWFIDESEHTLNWNDDNETTIDVIDRYGTAYAENIRMHRGPENPIMLSKCGKYTAVTVIDCHGEGDLCNILDNSKKLK